ncbi:MAG TPA: hypothetical protein VJB14_06630 [Planctomycetota bacterium]|nr:hypothetical protein [Planctomycetota bacterium]
MKRTALTTLIFAFGLTALAQEGKTELRYSLKKGEKLAFGLTHGLSVKLDKVPEILQGVVTEDPISVEFEGVVDMEVLEVAEDGTAKLSGKWRTAKAKGHVMVNDIDFDYDVAKVEDKPKKNDPAEDPALAGFGDLQDQLATMVRTPLKISVDGQGKVSLVEGSGKLGEIESAFRSLNGLMGPLPKGKVGKGDSWKDELKLGMPGVGGNVDIKIRAENTIDAAEKVDGKDVFVIKSKFAVGKLPGEKEDAPADGIEVKIKTEGEGEGRTLFSLTDGRALKSNSALRVKVSATIPNPGGGEDMDLKAQLKIETSHTLK